MNTKDGVRFTAALVFAFSVSVACSDGESRPGSPASDSESGSQAGTTSSGGVASGGSGGASGGSGGDAGNGGDSGSGGIAEPGSGGSLADAGAAGEGVFGGEACGDVPSCDEPGWSCDGNTLVNCVEAEHGCLIEMRTDCGTQVCQEGDSARCVNRGSSCRAARTVDGTTAIWGRSFAADFEDGQNFAGDGCPALGLGAPDAVFEVVLRQGQTIVATEVGEHQANTDPSIDAHFAVMSACGDQARCLEAADAPDTFGISYTAEQDETVYLWVGAEVGDEGLYDIRIEYVTNLGLLDSGATVRATEEGDLVPGELITYHFELSEDAVLYGTLEATTTGDVDLGYLYDESGNLVFNSLTVGSEDFAVPLEAGDYRFVVFVYAAPEGYTLVLSADPLTDLGSFDAGVSFTGDFAGVSEGRSEFFQFLLSSTTDIEWTLTSSDSASGVAQLWAYRDGLLLATAANNDGIASLVGSALPGPYLLQVLATPGGGNVPDYQLDLTF